MTIPVTTWPGTVSGFFSRSARWMLDAANLGQKCLVFRSALRDTDYFVSVSDAANVRSWFEGNRRMRMTGLATRAAPHQHSRCDLKLMLR